MKKVAFRLIRVILIIGLLIATQELVCKKRLGWGYLIRQYSDTPFKTILEKK